MTEGNTHALMLRDTAAELMHLLKEAPATDDYEWGYRQGLVHAIDLIRQEAAAFGIAEDVGLMDFEATDYLTETGKPQFQISASPLGCAVACALLVLLSYGAFHLLSQADL